jgi:hypothetical protein
MVTLSFIARSPRLSSSVNPVIIPRMRGSASGDRLPDGGVLTWELSAGRGKCGVRAGAEGVR